MTQVPTLHTLDDSLALLREGYAYLPERSLRHGDGDRGAEILQTRLMLAPAVLLRGAEAASVFYGQRLTRVGALPPTALTLLQDKGSVATLDDGAHTHRKQMFLDLMGGDALDRLTGLFEEEWRHALGSWQRADHVLLLDAVEMVLTRTVCAWAGVPLGEPEAYERSRELAAMIDGAGSVGWRNLKGQLLRRRTERWAAGLVERVRDGGLHPPEGSALAVLAQHRDPSGDLLSPEVAAVELINVLRPTVAVARFVVFEALALHDHPEAPTDDADAFVLEVRRFYPFFPLVAGKVTEPFDWRGYHFPSGRRVVLDIYGTNRDPRSWDEPEEFRPQRFVGWAGDPYTLIPQGGGEFLTHHRCPGEWATIALMRTALRLLQQMRYDLPEQDLRVPLSRMPTHPVSRFLIRDVHA